MQNYDIITIFIHSTIVCFGRYTDSRFFVWMQIPKLSTPYVPKMTNEYNGSEAIVGNES